jgi:Lon protease-like protein
MGRSGPLAMFPLGTVLFPGAQLPLHVFEPRYRRLTDDCLAGDGTFGVVLIARGSEVGGGDERFGVATVARIVRASCLDDGRWFLLVEGSHRVAVTRWLDDDPYPRAVVDDVADVPGSVDEDSFARATAAVRTARALLSELGSQAPVVADLGAGVVTGTDSETATRLWRLCALAPVTVLDSQRLLETTDPATRVTLVAELCEALAGDLVRLLGGGPGAPAS